MYGDQHRLFVQLMLAGRVMNSAQLEEAAYVCHEKCGMPLPSSSGKEPFAEFISEVNNKLSSFHMRIKGAASEEDGSFFYALVNMRDDELSKRSTMFSGTEMKFFRKLVVKIVESEGGSLPATDVLNILREECKGNFVEEAAKRFLDRMVGLGCLVQDGGSLFLGRLTLVEMEPYLQEQLGTRLPKCYACKQTCVKGYKCPSADCIVKMHHHCVQQVFSRFGDATSHMCPQCFGEWNF